MLNYRMSKVFQKSITLQRLESFCIIKNILYCPPSWTITMAGILNVWYDSSLKNGFYLIKTRSNRSDLLDR